MHWKLAVKSRVKSRAPRGTRTMLSDRVNLGDVDASEVEGYRRLSPASRTAEEGDVKGGDGRFTTTELDAFIPMSSCSGADLNEPMLQSARRAIR